MEQEILDDVLKERGVDAFDNKEDSDKTIASRERGLSLS